MLFDIGCILIRVMWFFLYWSLNFFESFSASGTLYLKSMATCLAICFEPLKSGCVLRGSEIENHMFQTYCGCCEILVRCLLVEGASPRILDVCALELDII